MCDNLNYDKKEHVRKDGNKRKKKNTVSLIMMNN